MKEDANVGLKNGSERVKEPVLAVAVDLLLVLPLQAKMFCTGTIPFS